MQACESIHRETSFSSPKHYSPRPDGREWASRRRSPISARMPHWNWRAPYSPVLLLQRIRPTILGCHCEPWPGMRTAPAEQRLSSRRLAGAMRFSRFAVAAIGLPSIRMGSGGFSNAGPGMTVSRPPSFASGVGHVTRGARGSFGRHGSKQWPCRTLTCSSRCRLSENGSGRSAASAPEPGRVTSECRISPIQAPASPASDAGHGIE